MVSEFVSQGVQSLPAVGEYQDRWPIWLALPDAVKFKWLAMSIAMNHKNDKNGGFDLIILEKDLKTWCERLDLWSITIDGHRIRDSLEIQVELNTIEIRSHGSERRNNPYHSLLTEERQRRLLDPILANVRSDRRLHVRLTGCTIPSLKKEFTDQIFQTKLPLSTFHARLNAYVQCAMKAWTQRNLLDCATSCALGLYSGHRLGQFTARDSAEQATIWKTLFTLNLHLARCLYIRHACDAHQNTPIIKDFKLRKLGMILASMLTANFLNKTNWTGHYNPSDEEMLEVCFLKAMGLRLRARYGKDIERAIEEMGRAVSLAPRNTRYLREKTRLEELREMLEEVRETWEQTERLTEGGFR